MARVRDIASAELPPDLAEIYERFAVSMARSATKSRCSHMSRRRCTI